MKRLFLTRVPLCGKNLENIKVKKLMMIILVLIGQSLSLVETVHASDWTGKKVRILDRSLVCEYFYIEKAILLRQAGDTRSMQAYYDKGACDVTKGEISAVVVTDASSYSRYNFIEVVVNGESWWTTKEETSEGEPASHKEARLQREDRNAKTHARQKSLEEDLKSGSYSVECVQAKQQLVDLTGAGMKNTAQYKKVEAQVAECTGT